MSENAAKARLYAGDWFENETFINLDLVGLDLGGKEFFRCLFQNCQLGGSSWQRSKLEACVFRSCDLSAAKVDLAGLRGVGFESSKLLGVDFANVSPNPELAFDACKMRYVVFARLGLRRTLFQRCSLIEASFTDADLTDADFAGSELGGATFEGCTLTRTDFRTAVGLFIDPGRNRLKETRVPVETAVKMAESLGMVVAGYERTGGKPS